MVQTWDTNKKLSKITCSKCNSTFWLGATRYPVREPYKVSCLDCREILKKGNDTYDYFLTRIEEVEK